MNSWLFLGLGEFRNLLNIFRIFCSDLKRVQNPLKLTWVFKISIFFSEELKNFLTFHSKIL